ncbi:MAG: hypothetical protein QXY75_02570 [Candidatus Bathyarchaeia archaeon]
MYGRHRRNSPHTPTGDFAALSIDGTDKDGIIIAIAALQLSQYLSQQ